MSLSFLYKGWWIRYLIFFTLAIFSKETAVLLLVIFLLFHFRILPKRIYLVLTGIQVLLFTGIQLYKTIRFIDNPGKAIEFHLLDQMAAFSLHPFFSLFFI
jgi:hypothetical protein